MAEASTNGKDKREGGPEGTAAHSAGGATPPETAPVDDDADGLARGSTLGRYLVLEHLGAGAMGVVYAAYDPELDRKVAIKILRPHGKGDQERRRARLVREAKAIARVSHPNVVGIFDVGVHTGQVFMAMEYLAGGTLHDWLGQQKRSWREIVTLFVEVGRGLAGAHAEGLIHRDFKPDNVLLDKNGVPKVVDFGLVRLTAALDLSSTSSTLDEGEGLPTASAHPAASAGPEANLTRTGALAGTPAYMAPEQFLGQPVNESTDQFAFCIALYEALYGRRPFSGDTIVTLADSVTTGRMDHSAKTSHAPAWVLRILGRGLSTDRAARFPNMDALLRELQKDPDRALRRRVGLVGGIAALVFAGIAVGQITNRRHRDLDRQIAAHGARAEQALRKAQAGKAHALELRTHAFELFDQARLDEAERVWSDSRAGLATADTLLESAEQEFDAASALDPTRQSLRGQLAEVVFERATIAELEFRKAEVRRHLDRLADSDEGGAFRARWAQPGTVTLGAPRPVSLVLQRYVEDPDGRRRVVEVSRGRTPFTSSGVAPGSYRAVLKDDAGQEVSFPFVLHRGEQLKRELEMPLPGTVPPGFAFVPSGDFLYGEADDALRTSFLDTVPIHVAHTGPFLISRNEETYGEWIKFLESLPPDEEAKRTPFVSTHRDYLRLQRSKGAWWLELRPSTATFIAKQGEPITYPGRSTRAQQQWVNMPVGGVSVDDIEAFVGWRARKVRGARLCSDLEWERAARGADDRIYPHGDRLGVDDANFDLTYGRRPLGYGPDEVGLHKESRSPFGVDDLAGNLMEITRSGPDGRQFVARGGGYYYDRQSARLTNREPVERNLRYPTFGFRICADTVTN